MVVHTCHPSYAGSINKGIEVQARLCSNPSVEGRRERWEGEKGEGRGRGEEGKGRKYSVVQMNHFLWKGNKV
jgi:hypothetical protein